MGIFQVVVCMGLLAAFAQTQELQNCSNDTVTLTIESTEDTTDLASSILGCPNSDFAVEWVGEVVVEETIRVTGGTSLNIAGAGPDAIADGGGSTQLFVVDGGSSLHLSDMTISNCNASAGHGGAIFVNQSTVSFAGNMYFISNHAHDSDGGAIASYGSNVSWGGGGTEFSNNSAARGGAIYAYGNSTVSWDDNGTQFSSNSAGDDGYGGAIFASESTVSWKGDGIQFNSNFADRGGAICAYASTVSWDGDGTLFISNSGFFTRSQGGAIFAAFGSNVSWDGDGTQFISNFAGWGGAISTSGATVFWDGDETQFLSNYCDIGGGAINIFGSSTVTWDGDGTELSLNRAYGGGAINVGTGSTLHWDGEGAYFSGNHANSSGGAIKLDGGTVSWEGDGTQFISNYAVSSGGAVSAQGYWEPDANPTTVSWKGNGTHFSSNHASKDNGGAINVYNAAMSWDGDGTQFSSNRASGRGGAIRVEESTVSWHGDGTQFSSNYAVYDGGAISLHGDRAELSAAEVFWDGDNTQFSSNSAGIDGGAIFGRASFVSWDGTTNFESNVAGENAGALGFDEVWWAPDIIGATFINNSATYGGALYLFNSVPSSAFNFTGIAFQNNSASGSGGAVAAYEVGDEFLPVSFVKCLFSGNTASESGGAVEVLTGAQEFVACDFEDNSADVGGALRLGGSAVVSECSFLSNVAFARGLAIAVVGSASISGSYFDDNQLSCASGLYRSDMEQEDSNARFETVCFECSGLVECSGCTIGSTATPNCVAPLAHTTADRAGVTLETLSISPGYWRMTSESDNILACFHTDACNGGITGSESYCAPGYTGPYCAVCETDYSPSFAHTCTRCSASRRHGLVAATVIAALVVVFAVATIFKFLVSTEVEEGNTGCFRRRVLRAVPVQALKIIVVVWQILTQFADTANVTYPGVYQDFLTAVDVVNFDLVSVLAAGCLWSDIDFHGRLLVSTLGPLVVVGFLAMTYLIAVHRNGACGDAAVAEKIRHKHQTALLFVTFVIYSSVSSIVFQTFACETLDDGVEYLRADYRIHCTDAKHKVFEVYAGFMVFVYPVGIPLLYTVLLFQRRDVLAHACADKTKAQSIAGLWEAYRPERFYYEVVECGRRIMLTGVVVFIFPNDAAQVAITMLITFFFSMVFEVLAPYCSEPDMWLSRGGHAIVFLSMFDLLLLKVDVSGERDQSQAAFAGVLVAGHVLMILAIVVEVVGVCCSSRKTKVVEEEKEETSERPRVGSDGVPVFEGAPAPWRSFLRQHSVSEKAGPTRSVSGTVVATGVQ